MKSVAERLRILASRWRSVLTMLVCLAVVGALVGFGFYGEFSLYTAIMIALQYVLTAAAILALAVGAYQLDQAREMKRSLTKLLQEVSRQSETQADEMKTSLTTISQSIATQYVGEFSNFMLEITKKLRKAEERVTIMCDVTGYGYYSFHEEFKRYRAAIFSLAADKKTVELAVYSEEPARKAIETQFTELPKKEDEKEWRDFEDYKRRRKERIEEVTQLHDSLVQQSKDHRNEFNEHVSGIFEAHKLMPVYFWMVDDKEAIFSFAGLRIKPYEVAFKTVDPKLIEIFKRILDDVKDHSSFADREGENGVDGL